MPGAQIKLFTLLELLVTIGIIAVLTGMIMVGLSQARAVAKRTFCTNNLKQIGLAVNMYAQNNSSRFPNAVSLPSFYSKQGIEPIRIVDALLSSTRGNRQIFACPADSVVPTWFSREGSSYEFNGKLSGEHVDNFSEIREHGSSKVVVIFDYDCFHAVLPRPRAKNYLFADGHVGDID